MRKSTTTILCMLLFSQAASSINLADITFGVVAADYLQHPRIVSKCFDHRQNYGETGVDCGGPCIKKCSLIEGCLLDSDCLSGFCFQEKCIKPGCSDGIRNQGEEGVDCGRPCHPCPTCFDGILNQGEDEIDCGGPCIPCCPICESCADGTLNQGETDVDCGGPCHQCPTQKKCVADADCLSGFCFKNTCTKPTCADGIKNQGEESIDCGGSCKDCTQKHDREIMVVGYLTRCMPSPMLAFIFALAFVAYIFYHKGKRDVLSHNELILIDREIIEDILDERTIEL
ncbi:MAG: hypothetical protein U9M95_01870 [Candidatus Altiarchaeota archaeon]|nr:hypothetical protein [Candidatus Altiarchaeota archaeon]